MENSGAACRMKRTGSLQRKGFRKQQDCGNGQRGGNTMDGQYVSMEMHKEFEKRMISENERLSDEDKRQNRRIDALEDTVRQIGTLTASVEKLAISVESMAKAQEQQSGRLEAIEKRDGEMWRKVTGYIATAVLGIIVGFIFKKIGM